MFKIVTLLPLFSWVLFASGIEQTKLSFDENGNQLDIIGDFDGNVKLLIDADHDSTTGNAVVKLKGADFKLKLLDLQHYKDDEEDRGRRNLFYRYVEQSDKSWKNWVREPITADIKIEKNHITIKNLPIEKQSRLQVLLYKKHDSKTLLDSRFIQASNDAKQSSSALSKTPPSKKTATLSGQSAQSEEKILHIAKENAKNMHIILLSNGDYQYEIELMNLDKKTGHRKRSNYFHHYEESSSHYWENWIEEERHDLDDSAYIDVKSKSVDIHLQKILSENYHDGYSYKIIYFDRHWRTQKEKMIEEVEVKPTPPTTKPEPTKPEVKVPVIPGTTSKGGVLHIAKKNARHLQVIVKDADAYRYEIELFNIDDKTGQRETRHNYSYFYDDNDRRYWKNWVEEDRGSMDIKSKIDVKEDFIDMNPANIWGSDYQEDFTYKVVRFDSHWHKLDENILEISKSEDEAETPSETNTSTGTTPPAETKPTLPVETNTTKPTLPVETNTTKPTLPVETNTTKPTLPVETNTTKPTLPVETNTTKPTLPVETNTTKPTLPVETNTTKPTPPVETNTTKPTLPPQSEDKVLHITKENATNLQIIIKDNGAYKYEIELHKLYHMTGKRAKGHNDFFIYDGNNRRFWKNWVEEDRGDMDKKSLINVSKDKIDVNIQKILGSDYHDGLTYQLVRFDSAWNKLSAQEIKVPRSEGETTKPPKTDVPSKPEPKPQPSQDCRLDLDHLLAKGCGLIKEDTAKDADSVKLWGAIECDIPDKYSNDNNRVTWKTEGGDSALTALGLAQDNHAYRNISVKNGDDYYGERCELGRNRANAKTFVGYFEGDYRVTFVSLRLAEDFPLDTTMWQSVFQMKQAQVTNNSDGTPILSLHASDNQWKLKKSGGAGYSNRTSTAWRTPAEVGVWTRFAFEVYYSKDADKGWVKVYVDLNGDGDTLDAGEQSSKMYMSTLKYQIDGPHDAIPVGDAVPSHFRVGVYHDEDIDCPSHGCDVGMDNVQVIAP